MVKHILRDGTELDDITGLVVSKENNPKVYEILGRIKEGKCYEKNLETKIDAIQGLSR